MNECGLHPSEELVHPCLCCDWWFTFLCVDAGYTRALTSSRKSQLKFKGGMSKELKKTIDKKLGRVCYFQPHI